MTDPFAIDLPVDEVRTVVPIKFSGLGHGIYDKDFTPRPVDQAPSNLPLNAEEGELPKGYPVSVASADADQLALFPVHDGIEATNIALHPSGAVTAPETAPVDSTTPVVAPSEALPETVQPAPSKISPPSPESPKTATTKQKPELFKPTKQ